jgi:hypothetical protein
MIALEQIVDEIYPYFVDDPATSAFPDDGRMAMGDDEPLGCWYCDNPLPELPHQAYVDPCPHCGYIPGGADG